MSPTNGNSPAKRQPFYLVRLGVILFVGLILGVVILVSIGVISDFLSDWKYSNARDKLETKIMSAGFPPLVADEFADQPDLSLKSPDGVWTVTAQWIKGRGYNWGLANSKTGKVYFRNENIQSNSAFPVRCEALWSPDGRYVAVTSDLGGNTDYVDVINVSKTEPTFTSLRLSGSDGPNYPLKELLLKPEDLALATDWAEQRTDALKWQTPTDLNLVAFLIIRLGGYDSPERAAAARLTLRFSGNLYEVVSKKYEFYEELPSLGEP